MAILLDGPEGTKLGPDDVDGMHEMLGDDDLDTWELVPNDDEPDDLDEDEPDDTESLEKAARDILAVAEAGESKIADRLFQAFRFTGAAADAIVAAAMRSLNPEAAVEALRRSGLTDKLDNAFLRLDPVFMAGGDAAVDAPMSKADGKRIAVSFDLRNRNVDDFLQANRMTQIRAIEEEQAAKIRQIMLRGMAEGQPPKKIAQEIRDVVGLTDWQASQVKAYRTELEDLNPRVMERQLRDRRFDGPIARAVNDGKALTPEQIDRFTAEYKDNWLRLRATTIARTEALRAANSGGRMGL